MGYTICDENLEWIEGEWCVLAHRDGTPEDDFDAYVINTELRRMIAETPQRPRRAAAARRSGA